MEVEMGDVFSQVGCGERDRQRLEMVLKLGSC